MSARKLKVAISISGAKKKQTSHASGGSDRPQNRTAIEHLVLVELTLGSPWRPDPRIRGPREGNEPTAPKTFASLEVGHVR
jgi:hypothetical protein